MIKTAMADGQNQNSCLLQCTSIPAQNVCSTAPPVPESTTRTHRKSQL